MVLRPLVLGGKSGEPFVPERVPTVRSEHVNALSSSVHLERRSLAHYKRPILRVSPVHSEHVLGAGRRPRGASNALLIKAITRPLQARALPRAVRASVPVSFGQFLVCFGMAAALMASGPVLAGQPKSFAQGCQAMLKGQYEEAIVFLSVAAKAQPKNPKPVERLLKCYGALGRYADATKLLRAAAAKALLSQSLVESDLKSTTALMKARSLHRSGKSDNAIRLLKPFAGKKCYYVAVELDIAKLLVSCHASSVG